MPGAGVVALLLLVLLWALTREVPPAGDIDPSPPPIASPFEEIDIALSELQPATIAFNPPSEMQYGGTVPVGVLVSLTLTPEELTHELTQRVPRGAAPDSAIIRASPILDVRLSGDEAFKIMATTSTRQAVGGSEPTEWRWDVTAIDGGVHYLHLTVDANLTIAGREVPRTLRTLDRAIQVQISAPQRVQVFWSRNSGAILTIFTAVVIPLTVWRWRSWRKNKATAKPPYVPE